MKSFLAILYLCVCVSLSSCAGSKTRFGSSYHGPVPETVVINMAVDATQQLAELYPPGRTSLYLEPETKDSNPVKSAKTFGELLDNRLRAKGFKILQEKNAESLHIRWIIDLLSNEYAHSPSYYLYVWVDEKEGIFKTISRVYNGNGAAQGGFATGLGELSKKQD